MRLTPTVLTWLTFLGLLLVFVLSGFLGELDYQDQRIEECARLGKVWDKEADVCVKSHLLGIIN